LQSFSQFKDTTKLIERLNFNISLTFVGDSLTSVFSSNKNLCSFDRRKQIQNLNFKTMKKITLSLFALTLVVSAFAQQLAMNTKPVASFTTDAAIFNWTVTSFDFGKIQKDRPVTQEFSFINGGNVPLVITSVQASCGCTVAEYSKNSIAPGEKGFVKATYNAAKVGSFHKTVSVNANTEEGIVQLIIKGEVVE
jgi:hypothetical protein